MQVSLSGGRPLPPPLTCVFGSINQWAQCQHTQSLAGPASVGYPATIGPRPTSWVWAPTSERGQSTAVRPEYIGTDGVQRYGRSMAVRPEHGGTTGTRYECGAGRARPVGSCAAVSVSPPSPAGGADSSCDRCQPCQPRQSRLGAVIRGISSPSQRRSDVISITAGHLTDGCQLGGTGDPPVGTGDPRTRQPAPGGSMVLA